MKTKQLLSLLFIFIIVFISCSKENDYPKKFTRKEFISGDIKMFTNSGQVLNEHEILEFAERVRSFFLGNSFLAPDYVYSFEDDINVYDAHDVEFILFSDSKGEVVIKSNDTQQERTLRFTVKRQSDYSIISAQDTITSYINEENPIFKCTPEIVFRRPLPATSGYTEEVKFLRPFYVKIKGDEIHLCITSYMNNQYYNNQFRSISILGARNNLINEEYLQSLQSPSYNLIDTIAYKESYIVFY